MPTASREPDFRDPACRSWRFTQARIDTACRLVAEGAVPTDASGRVQWRDADTAGLFLRVTATGTGTYTLFFKREGRPVRKAIGLVGVVTLGEAREAALALRYDRTLAAAVRPRERKAAAGAGPTVGDAFDAYIEAAEAGTFTLGRRKQPITDRTAQGYRDTFKATLEPYRGASLEWLAENVLRLHREVGTPSGTGKARKPGRPYQANRMLQLARTIFTFAAREGWWTQANPCADPATGAMPRFDEHARSRILTDEEEVRLGAALVAEEPLWRDLFGLALLTGRRMSAVCRIRWGDIDLGRAVWTAPREEMKGRKAAHGITLDPDAVALLKRRRAAAGDSEWVFPAIRSPGPVATWKTAWARIRDAAGLGSKDRSRRVRPHDLRRSWGSRLIEAGAPTVTVNAALGNSPASVGMTARVYMHVPDAVAAEAVDAAYRRRQARQAKAKRSRARAKKSAKAP